MPTILISLACACIAATPDKPAEPPDLQKIERKIAKEPAYTSEQPLYGLLTFGPKASLHVWLVLDKSDAAAEQYDVLYADLNANGDLTEANEKYVLKGEDVRFRLPDFEDSANDCVHTEFVVRGDPESPPKVMVSLKWRDGFSMGGGYPEDPEQGYMQFAEEVASAPVLWANGDGPFRFQRWYGDKLTIGAADDLKCFVGQLGSGKSSFWAFREHFLPEEEGLQATLIYEDNEGKERRHVCMLKERC
jgi:hypothetical protein